MRKTPKPIQKASSVRRLVRSPSLNLKTGEVTIGDLLRYLSPQLSDDKSFRVWPPDIFALAASILQKSGGYLLLVSDWPPRQVYKTSRKRWIRDIKKTGRRWRKAWVRSRRAPDEIVRWWTCVLDHRALPLREILGNSTVCHALLQLCAAADEASNGVGVPSLTRSEDSLQDLVRKSLVPQRLGGSTLCKMIDRSRIRVLPKLHTPQSGMTLRSISHHLAVCPSGDVETSWFWPPKSPKTHCLNLLLIPWPDVTAPSHFRASEGSRRGLPPEFGYFTYDIPSQRPAHLRDKIKALLENARSLVGTIDGVILPELALTPIEHGAVRGVVTAAGAFLLSGIRQSADRDKPGRNFLSLTVPLPGKLYSTSYDQEKHHRWLLDKRQIVQYGLGGRLDPSCSWWEYMSLEPRKLAFFAMKPWLTLCALICEDLARQDPVTEIVRAIGPNLVVALLMDGPQLASRWSARYATVLADDPGSSVLTLTSIGMAQLSRPPYAGAEKSRTIGLWKDAITGAPIPIELPNGAEATVLSLVAEYKEEWTADGRSDGGASGYPVFGGAHPVYV